MKGTVNAMVKLRLQKLLKKSPTESAQPRIGEPVLEDYARAEDFNERRFWHKLKGVAKKAGYSVLEKCLWLYYTVQKPDTPKWAKTAIYAALAYFVLPLDAIPDFIPGIGYSDDVSILASALLSVSLYLDASVKQQATEKLSVWFGDRDE